jgi:four helix bundle protein
MAAFDVMQGSCTPVLYVTIDELEATAHRFAVSILKLHRQLPKTEPQSSIGRQLVRAGTSVALNFRASRRSRSHVEFVSRTALVAEEADECVGWLNLLADSDLRPGAQVQPLLGEARELTAIFSASYRTARRRHGRR